ncbi:hypothetical protein [Flavobacterium capsici]|uniref:Uncharacterized protein n=1 Tax=Flavobacterium capsici TaxID=3075618 RepID=A0AA96F269_9FLAO|nr:MULTISPECIES: hypothetical protein [unclassified Flavobacterium]WNM18602.1 hypothetical protein RN608_11350 [Flavobacterium sp. PMR2A8]WNM22653.1 hypothetical protein RN605_04650 [Flavobacterium sp. PMTSA4]
MEKKIFNQISIAYQNLSNRFQNYNRQYIDLYYVYPNNLMIFEGEKLEFLLKFSEIPFGGFFKDTHKNQFYNQNYFNGNCVINEENTIKIHYDFSLILFFYLVNSLKDDLNTFLEILESEEFKQTFNVYIKIDENSLSYHTAANEKIWEYFKSKIDTIGYINHIICVITTDIVYINIDSYVEINKNVIRSILKQLDDVYNFDGFEIK